jgi:hypothetical protein
MRRPIRLIIASVCGPVLSLSGSPPFASAQPRPASAPRAPVAPSTRVENGVTVHAHDAGAFARAPQWTLDAKPILTAGGANGDPDFDLTYASDAATLSDGRLVTFSAVGAKIFVFGADGRARRAIGRLGKGPGEFMSPTGLLHMAGDTLFVIDPANNRLNWLTADAGVVREAPRNVALTPRYARPVGYVKDRGFVLMGGAVQEAVTGKVVRKPATVLLMTAAGEFRTISDVPNWELVEIETRYRGKRNVDSRILRFSRRAHVVVRDTQVITADGEGYAIRVNSTAGQEQSRIQVATTRRPVTRAMRDAEVAADIARIRGPHMEAMIDPAESERQAREAPSADLLPPYESLHVTPDGTLWVVDAIAPTDTSWSATAFRRDGAIVGRLRAGGNAMPITFGNDRVVLRTVDADGVVAFVVRRIVR